MTRRNATVALVALALVVIVACRPTPPVTARDAEGELQLVRSRYVEAFNARDAQALTSLFTSDAQLLPPGQPVVKGREAILGFWRRAFGDAPVALALVPAAGESVPGLAWEGGDWEARSETGPSRTGKYLIVFRRVGRDWRIQREIWNQDPPPPPTPTPVPSGPGARAGDDEAGARPSP